MADLLLLSYSQYFIGDGSSTYAHNIAYLISYGYLRRHVNVNLTSYFLFRSVPRTQCFVQPLPICRLP